MDWQQGEKYIMEDILKARLNLNAVLRNLEALPALDPEAAEIIREWTVSVRFGIRNDLSARLRFNGGRCAYEANASEPADVSLFFWSGAHLNAMFENQANPIPLRGFRRLGFLKNEFPRITQRLEYFLKPTDELLDDPAYLRVNTTLTLYTAVFAACELARLDPIARAVAQQTPAGALQMSILPEGPHAHLLYDGRGGVRAGRGPAEQASAVITLRDMQTANRLFNGKLDGFGAVALGDVKLKGVIPLVDNTNLILDRIPLYLQ